MAQPLKTEELLALVDVLADGQWHSGEALAARDGITRAALAKRMDHVRDWQLDVESRKGLGYRLSAPLERLDAARLAKSLPRGLGLRIAPLTDSTNTQLLAANAADDPQFLLAEFQTNGRGRRGRSWMSPFGANLYCSLAWSFREWPPQLTALPLAVGVVCARVLREMGATPQLKWPNDLWLDGKKAGGILIEHRGEAGGACRVVIGIGLNVAMSAAQAQAIDQPYTSVEAHLQTRVSRNALAETLLPSLIAALEEFCVRGFAPFRADWNLFDLTANCAVRIEGAAPFNGIARGIDRDGALLVEAGGERHAVHAGDVSLRLP